MSKLLFIQSIIVFILAVIMVGCSPTASNTTLSQPVSGSKDHNSCTITCYEKTPTCYVSENAPGCLTISDEKPASSGETKTCVLPACEKKVTYPLRGLSSQPYVVQ